MHEKRDVRELHGSYQLWNIGLCAQTKEFRVQEAPDKGWMGMLYLPRWNGDWRDKCDVHLVKWLCNNSHLTVVLYWVSEHSNPLPASEIESMPSWRCKVALAVQTRSQLKTLRLLGHLYSRFIHS